MYKRFHALDGVRGYAAFAVLVYHAVLIYDMSLIKRVLNLPIQSVPGVYDKLIKTIFTVFDGKTAVMIFFTLSGLVLSIALRKSVLSNSFLVNLDFALKRIVRIYPTLIVSLVFFWASRVLLNQFNPNIFPLFALKSLFDNAILIKPVINGATWTLQAEILAIPFLLFCFAVQKQFGIKGLTLIVAFSILCLDKALQLPIIPVDFYSSLLPFVCGFLIASPQTEQLFFMVGKDLRFLMIIFGSMFFIPLFTHPTFVAGGVVQEFCISIFLGALYYRQFNPLLRILESRPSIYLGKISFSFYLNNVIFLDIFSRIFAAYSSAKDHPLEFGLLTTVICATLGIILSHFTEKYVEQPSIKLGKAITRFLSSIDTKYLMRPVLNPDENIGEDLQNVVIIDLGISKEKAQ